MFEFERVRDRELLRRFCAGDRDAFAEIYREKHGAVFRFARAMTGDQAKAAEVTQDVFVWLIHHAGDFDPARGELGGFLMGVARKLMKRRFSEERRWVPIEESLLAPARTRDDGPDSRHDTEYDTELLRHAIAALPQRYREVVVLCDLEGRSYEEAAAIADCVVGTVRSRLHRARALLARKLAPKGMGTQKLGRGCAADA
jgi:RNA polymerase sigma-70 factor (ECF subfamily)